MENSEKKGQHSQERVKSTEKRSSRSFKSFASTVAATERVKRTSVTGRHKQESCQEREGKSQSKDGRGSAQYKGKHAFPELEVFPHRYSKLKRYCGGII